jgi:cytochrome c oxidase subunit 2
MGAVFALFSGWYFWIPKILGLDYNILYSKAHFWVLFTGVNLTFFPQHFLGLQGMPRRISDYPDAFTGWNFVSSVGSIVSVVATALFLHIVYLQLVKGKAVYGYPWAVPQLFSDYLRILKDKCAPGLEWALSNPPKPHAFTSLPLQSSNPVDLNNINNRLDNFENISIPSANGMKEAAGNSLTNLDTVRDEYVARVENTTADITTAINNATLTTQDKVELTQLKTELANLKTRNIVEAHDTARDLLEGSENALSPFVATTAAGPMISTLFVLLRVYFDKSFRYFSSVFYSIYKTRINLIFITLVMFLVVYYSTSVIYCDAPRAWGLYFQDSASPQMEALVELHDNIMYYLVAILFAVGWIQGAIIKNFNSAKSPISNKYLNHGTLIELIWTITPALILVLIAFPSFKLLYLMDEVTDPSLSVLAEGHQWYWSYEYPDFLNSDGDFVEFDSYLVPESDLEEGALRMLEVDNRVILPEITHTRFILTAADVIHSFAIPALGVKCDAYPGRLNQFSVLINRLGTFYGQCSEICGILHSSMPIVVESVSLEKFLSWLQEQ